MNKFTTGHQPDRRRAVVASIRGRDLADGRHECRDRGCRRPVQSGAELADQGHRRLQRRRKSDILWQNSDGTAAIWLMNGMNAVTVGAVGPFNPGPSWQVKGSGDFNGDGKSDILWQHDGGTPAMWFMDGMNFLSGGAAGSFNPGHDWHVIA